MSELAYAQVQAHLARLRLTRLPECLDTVAEEASKGSWSDVQFLDHLLEAEIAARTERDIAMKTKLARFPFSKTLEQFDFGFQPSIEERQVKELATLRFVHQAENLLILGPPGTGKTHLAIALGMQAIGQGISVFFVTTATYSSSCTGMRKRTASAIGCRCSAAPSC